jgi:hypothetical protein
VDTANVSQQCTLGGYNITAKLTDKDKNEAAGALIVNIGPDEFIVAGKALDVLFTPVAGRQPYAAIDIVDEGIYKNGNWIPGRRLNGDEVHTSVFAGTGLKFTAKGYSIQHVKLYTYK